MNQKIKVVEIFQSIQGEGANAGRNCVFIRLAGCNMNCPFCDTKWDIGKDMSIKDVLEELKNYCSDMIVWTGGEPTLQLTNDILRYFDEYFNCIETNGTNKVPSLISYVSVSPKVSQDVLVQNIDFANEIRYAIKSGDIVPDISTLPPADNYFLSPIFNDKKLSKENLDYCLKLIKENPKWKLSVQIHNLLNVR